MILFRIFSYEVLLELWCSPFRLRDWQLGTEQHAGLFPTRFAFFGPFLLAASKVH